MGTATFFAAPDYGDREPARPKAVNPRTGKEQSWTRASSFASALDNPYGLMRRDGRNIVMGMSRRPDLARMALTGATADDVSKVDELVTTAKEVMASSAKANEGTAAHAAITRAWQHPDEPVPEEYVLLVKAFASALKEHGLTIRDAAQKVMNLAYNSIGEFDFVLEEVDGSLVIGDAKSGKLEQAKRKFAVQLAMYDGAEFIIKKNGSVVPMPYGLAHTHGVLIHLDLEHNAVSVYRIDLRIGRYGAGLAEQVRQWHTLDPLSPYVQPVYRSDRSNSVGPAPQAIDRGVTVNEHGEDGVTVNEHEDEADLIDQAIEEAGGAPEQSAGARFNELMTMDKAPLQQLLKKTFGWTDDAHNRRWLARAVVALEQGLTGREVVKYAAAKDDQTNPGQPELSGSTAQQVQAPSEQTIPQGPSSETLLEAIAGANSEGAIDALRKDIVERRGDQAWTDELVTAARARVLELLGSVGNAVGAEERALAQIASATTQAELKEVWDRMTLGNTVPENWTQKLTDAGLARLDEIKRATPPPPANPFA